MHKILSKLYFCCATARWGEEGEGPPLNCKTLSKYISILILYMYIYTYISDEIITHQMSKFFFSFILTARQIRIAPFSPSITLSFCSDFSSIESSQNTTDK